MARQNWDELQTRFLAAHDETGITPQAWCEQQGIIYSTAKRYIKIAGYKTANSQKKRSANSQKKTANSQRKSNVAKAENTASSIRSGRSISQAISAPADFGISEQQGLFADYIVRGKTRIEAYRLAGYEGTGNAAYVTASQLLRNPKIARYVHHLRNLRQQRHAVELDDLIAQLVAIINADPNEIAQYRRVNCRHCWGEGHGYQWRDIAEQLQAEAKAQIDKKPPPDVSGGIGFTDSMDPNPDCPRCNGEGKGEAHFNDTRDLEGDARYLLQGVKVGKCGVEIVISDKDAARRELARLLVINGSDARRVDLALQREELQIDKLRAEIAEIRRNTPPPPGEGGDIDGFEIDFISVATNDKDADPTE
ncbi:terminase small subunit [Yokenella regensburgei]|uniref:terminase small subunit n=1 Tax=Yokenella regensburgei TaxID=158877 RepID=UPI0031DB803F